MSSRSACVERAAEGARSEFDQRIQVRGPGLGAQLLHAAQRIVFPLEVGLDGLDCDGVAGASALAR